MRTVIMALILVVFGALSAIAQNDAVDDTTTLSGDAERSELQTHGDSHADATDRSGHAG